MRTNFSLWIEHSIMVATWIELNSCNLCQIWTLHRGAISFQSARIKLDCNHYNYYRIRWGKFILICGCYANHYGNRFSDSRWICSPAASGWNIRSNKLEWVKMLKWQKCVHCWAINEVKKRESGLNVNAVAAGAILSVTYGGSVIVSPECFGANSPYYCCHVLTTW